MSTAAGRKTSVSVKFFPSGVVMMTSKENSSLEPPVANLYSVTPRPSATSSPFKNHAIVAALMSYTNDSTRTVVGVWGPGALGMVRTLIGPRAKVVVGRKKPKNKSPTTSNFMCCMNKCMNRIPLFYYDYGTRRSRDRKSVVRERV